MAITQLSFTAPDVAMVVELDFSGVTSVLAFTEPDVVTTMDDTNIVSSTNYTSLTSALAAAQALVPEFPPEEILGELDLSINYQSPPTEVLPGDVAYLSVTASSTDSGVSYAYQWLKNDLEIHGATSATLTGTFSSGMVGLYKCVVTAAQSSTGRETRLPTLPIPLTETTPRYYADDALGAQDPYGVINTGRGGGLGSGGPNDLNPSYITLIDTTYTQSQLELYVPTTSTVISYDGTLTAPFRFDSAGNCFNGTDFDIEIRVAATGVVLATVTVPETQTNTNIYWY